MRRFAAYLGTRESILFFPPAEGYLFEWTHNIAHFEPPNRVTTTFLAISEKLVVKYDIALTVTFTA